MHGLRGHASMHPVMTDARYGGSFATSRRLIAQDKWLSRYVTNRESSLAGERLLVLRRDGEGLTLDLDPGRACSAPRWPPWHGTCERRAYERPPSKRLPPRRRGRRSNIPGKAAPTTSPALHEGNPVRGPAPPVHHRARPTKARKERCVAGLLGRRGSRPCRQGQQPCRRPRRPGDHPGDLQAANRPGWRSGKVAVPIEPDAKPRTEGTAIGQELAWRRVHEHQEAPGRSLRRSAGSPAAVDLRLLIDGARTTRWLPGLPAFVTGR